MTNDILTGLRVPSQVPLNSKEWVLNEATLKNLGSGNTLAYTYHKGLVITCIEERTQYEWKEIEAGDIGLISSNFIYPPGIIVNGVTYSNKEYNFVKVKVGGSEQNNFVRSIVIQSYNLPSKYTKQDICNYVLSLPESQRTVLETDSKWNIIIEDQAN